ncbi:cold-shock protein [Paenibacillus sp. Y412MC10]|uniref:cold-shock protein n=1 Tax=Geobacillus sp. (strain Y412MC10) TaxID=481743 RepID=UPI0011A07F60|nr:cold shock domain-containing protein [Paenibacillus sp. Y412MC10]
MTRVWNGLSTEEMAEVYSMIEPTGYKSPVAPPKEIRSKGTVRKFNDPKRYGFVEVDSTGERIFFHINESVDPGLAWLSYGERISFDIEEDAKGRSQAVKIKLIGRTR